MSMYELPDGMRAMAQANDDETAGIFEDAAPVGEFSQDALNDVVAALNKVLPMFDMEQYPEFTSDMPQLPGEFVKQLGMVQAASTDAGTAELPDISSMTDDEDLRLLAGSLETLADDGNFVRFLKSRPGAQPEAEAEVEEDPKKKSKGKKKKKPEDEDEGIDDMFTARG